MIGKKLVFISKKVWDCIAGNVLGFIRNAVLHVSKVYGRTCLSEKDLTEEHMNLLKFVIAVLMLMGLQFVVAGEFHLRQQEALSVGESLSHGLYAKDGIFEPIVFSESTLRIGNKSTTLSGKPESIEISPLGKFVAIVQRGPRDSNGNHEINVGVMSTGLQLAYTVAALQYLDEGAPLIRVSDLEGVLLIGRSTTGEIWVYGPSGLLLRHIRLFNDDGFDPERFLDIQFCRDGTFTTLATRQGSAPSDAPIPDPDGEPTLFRFDDKGRPMWQQKLDGGSVNQLVVDRDNGKVMVNPYHIYSDGRMVPGTTVFGPTGRNICNLKVHFKSGLLSRNSERAVLMTNRRAECYQISSGDRNWQFQLKVDSGIILGAVAIAKDRVLLLSGKEGWDNNRLSYSQLRLQELDANGVELAAMNLDFATDTLPRLQVDKTGQVVALLLADQFLVYEVTK